MIIAALVAFAHFFAFFALTAALILQLTLIAESISVDTAKRIQRADQAYGIAALLLLIFGLLRVFYFEKGADYYFSILSFCSKSACWYWLVCCPCTRPSPIGAGMRN